MKRILLFFFVLLIGGSTKLFAQVSFNDLLIVSEVDQAELVDGLLVENNYTFKGVEKDKEGWTVYTWSYSNGTAWLEYKQLLEENKETGKIEKFCMTTFFTTSKSIYIEILNQMKIKSWSKYNDKQLTGENMNGFNSYLYYGEKTFFSQKKGVLVGENTNYRGTTAYRFAFL